MLCLVAQSRPNLCYPTDCSPPGSAVHADSPGKNIGVGCNAFLQGIFPTKGWNPGLPHCRQILNCLRPLGKPKNSGVGSLSLLQGILLIQELNQGPLNCRQILYQLSYQGSPESCSEKPIWELTDTLHLECILFTVYSQQLQTTWCLAHSGCFPSQWFLNLFSAQVFETPDSHI